MLNLPDWPAHLFYAGKLYPGLPFGPPSHFANRKIVHFTSLRADTVCAAGPDSDRSRRALNASEAKMEVTALRGVTITGHRKGQVEPSFLLFAVLSPEIRTGCCALPGEAGPR